MDNAIEIFKNLGLYEEFEKVAELPPEVISEQLREFEESEECKRFSLVVCDLCKSVYIEALKVAKEREAAAL